MAPYNNSFKVSGLDLQPEWHVVDAKDQTLGRLSTEVAILLQGKHRPTYVPYLNTGDFVVVINAEKIRVTGNKLKQKIYYRHSGYPGGLTEETLEHLLGRAPIRALKHAVKGMLPKNTVGKNMLSRLKLYAGHSHPHSAQINARPKTKVTEDKSKSVVGKKSTSGHGVNASVKIETSEPEVVESVVKSKPKTRGASVPIKEETPKTKSKTKISSSVAKATLKPRRRGTASNPESSDAEPTTQDSPEEK